MPWSSTGASARPRTRPSAGSRSGGTCGWTGHVGPDTWGQLVEAGYHLGDRTLYLHSPNFRGDDVRALQRKLNVLGFDAGRQDGLFGPNTDRALREFQRNVGEYPDGIAGPHVITTLERMRPQESGPSRALIREEEELRQVAPPSKDPWWRSIPGTAAPTAPSPSRWPRACTTSSPGWARSRPCCAASTRTPRRRNARAARTSWARRSACRCIWAPGCRRRPAPPAPTSGAPRRILRAACCSRS